MSTIRRTLVAIAVVALGLGAPSCSRPALSGPPELKLGRDECADCGMLVSEDRCSSALLIEVSGVREHAIFDDIGCMLDYMHEPPADTRAVEAFVHDHGTRQWISADASFVLFADRAKLKTPMGFGIVAVASRNEAERLQRSYGGEIVSWSEASARRLVMKHRPVPPVPPDARGTDAQETGAVGPP